MTAAAATGAAPSVRFADATTGVSIVDFVAGRPISEHPGGPVGMARALGALTARVGAAPLFPMLGDYPEMIGGMLTGLIRSGLFAPGLLDPHAKGLARIRRALPWDSAALVSSHNDPNPRNLLFDGERVWLIDWELAFRNDPLADIAILTTELAETPEQEDALLEAAFGGAPDRALRARLRVMQLLTRLFYGCIVLEGFFGEPRSAPGTSLAARAPASFRAAVADGVLASGARETAQAFAMMSLAAFVDGVTSPGFGDLLAVVGEQATRSEPGA